MAFTTRHRLCIISVKNAKGTISMTFDEIYATMKTYFEQRDFEVFGQGVYSYEFDVTGEGEGKFYIEIKDGSLNMQPYDYKNSLCSFKISSGNLIMVILILALILLPMPKVWFYISLYGDIVRDDEEY